MKINNLAIAIFFVLFSLESFAAEKENLRDSEFGILKYLVKEDQKNIIAKNDNFKPEFVNKAVYGVTFNDEYQATNRKDEYKDTKSDGYLFSSLRFYKNLSVNSFVGILRSSKSSEDTRRDALTNGGGDISFEDEGVFLKELNLSYDAKNYALVLGKFDANFGNAWRWDRGIWSQNLAQNYRQEEKLGFSGIYRAGDLKEIGLYKFGYAIFTNDRKNLDNSIVTKRDSNGKSDAKAGDTRSLESYIASIDIDFDFDKLEKLSYHFAYMNLGINDRVTAVAKNKIDNQKGYVLGMNYEYQIFKDFFSKDVILDWMVEYVDMKNIDGDSDVGEEYVTGNIIAKFYDGFSVFLSHSRRRNSNFNQNGIEQNLSEVSIGYDFGKNIIFDKLSFQIGYRNQRDDFKTSLETKNSFGGLVRLYKNF